MRRPNFCVECGERLARKSWRGWIGRRFCAECSRRLGTSGLLRPFAMVAIIALSGFALGRYLRPPAPPLIIQRAANSPLSDLPLNGSGSPSLRDTRNFSPLVSTADEPGYICGARTKKGTPCHRRVHVAGERCFQHKGLTAMLPLEKLVVKSK